MIKIRPLASSSKANAYIVDNGTDIIQIEAGFSLNQQRPLSRPLDSRAVLLSHEHSDHSRGIYGFLQHGVDCYMSRGTATALEVMPDKRVKLIKHKEGFGFTSWLVIPFNLVHDASEPLGFLLTSITGKYPTENLLFATDTAVIPHLFHDLTHIVVECNYQQNILLERFKTGELSFSRYKRLMQSHMSLETLVRYLKNTDCSRLKEMWLIHVSDENINENKMLESLEGIVHCPIFIA